MPKVIGVTFRPAGKIYYFDPEDMELEKNDYVIVETSRGVEFGLVIQPPHEVSQDEVVEPLKPVIRKATIRDKEQYYENKELEREAFTICLDKIEEHGLPMKLVDVEYTFEHNKILFYFTADGRVDFRELVKDLARIFKTRIELRQIGVRDEAKMIGGLGPCGMPTCCTRFLREFEPVSINMAKEQELSLNPAKISGICGRLMCCMRYEEDCYKEMKKEMPDRGQRVKLEVGSGEVIDRNLIKKTVRVSIGDDETVEIDAEKLPGYEPGTEYDESAARKDIPTDADK